MSGLVDQNGMPITSKTPIKFIGGKSKPAIVAMLASHLPEGLKRLYSGFLGGGGFEVNRAAAGLQVHAVEKFTPGATFWQQILENPQRVADAARQHYPLSSQGYRELTEATKTIKDPVELAGAYYAVNRRAFRGGGFGKKAGVPHDWRKSGFTLKALNEMSQFNNPNLHVQEGDAFDFVRANDGEFFYFDPPYHFDDPKKEKLYGHDGELHDNWPHEDFRNLITNRPGWMMSYGDTGYINDLYRGHPILRPQWHYSSNHTPSKEVLIFSKDLANQASVLQNRIG